MADAGVQIKKKRTFKKYTYRGVDLDQLLAIKVFSVYELSNTKGSSSENKVLLRKLKCTYLEDRTKQFLRQ